MNIHVRVCIYIFIHTYVCMYVHYLGFEDGIGPVAGDWRTKARHSTRHISLTN